MYPRKRTAQRRWFTVIGILCLLVITTLAWWQHAARRSSAYSPAEQLLITILSPSMRLSAAWHDRMVIAPDFPLDPVQQLPRVGMDRLTALEVENQQLRTLLKLRDALPSGAIAAEVIGRSISPWQENLLLGAGAADGVAPHMVALTPGGVLGQIVAVAGRQSEVLLLTDRASGIGGMIARTRETGVLKGLQNGQCQLIYLSDKSDVRTGDEVVTSGLSDYFPKGLPLGTVVSVADDPALSSRIAIVTPAANPAIVEMAVLTK